ncbi:DUF3440 domain-containing protein [Enterococcus sp. DIV0212c]|uniref:DUF3440 domain-containing protein n=1 Tax=Enterococcus sp. DIV0212c TaxID=2230867 RepID=UPI001A9A793D|nr:DUF3440 domain-containing protein [Enterococcus sp. DIV0212c]
MLEKSIERLTFMFNTFDRVYFSFSGGKDSGVMVLLANMVAKKMGKKFDLLILNIEANYDSTDSFISTLEKLESIECIYHFCLPFYEDNTLSIFQPQWKMWDEKVKNLWVQEMPEHALTLNNIPTELRALFDSCYGNPDVFLSKFGNWYYQFHKGEDENFKVVCGIGIRTQESLNRYLAITKGKHKWANRSWLNLSLGNCIKAYPIYDWSVEDIFAAYSYYDWPINQFYEKCYKLGIPLSLMRICQPFGLHQRRSLTMYAAIEPATWEKIVKRVSGVNFGMLYAQTSVLGHFKTSKPAHMTWQEYAIFLLESIGLVSPALRDHYYRKIKILMDYYEKNFGMSIADIVDEAKAADWKYDEKLWHNWKGIARAIEKNDFSLSTRQYSFTQADAKDLYAIYDDYKGSLNFDDSPNRAVREFKKKI